MESHAKRWVIRYLDLVDPENREEGRIDFRERCQ